MAKKALMTPPGEDGADVPPRAAFSGQRSAALAPRCGTFRFGFGLAMGLALCTAGWAQAPGPGVPEQGASLALLKGQTARALQGSFNTVPVLHSNQPEAV
jgi:hypothetical protein